MSKASASWDDAVFAPRRGTRVPGWAVWALAAAIILALAGLIAFQPTNVIKGEKSRTLNVVLPPPPPPPPPEVREKPPEPEKKVMDEVTPQPDTPPPPTPQQSQSDDVTVGDNALTARVGPAAGNYGVAAGNGSGATVGGRPGGSGNGFVGYGQRTYAEVRRAVQADRGLTRGTHEVRLDLVVAEDGTVRDVRVVGGSEDADWLAALRRRIVGMKLSQRPPAGLPPVRIDLTIRPSL